MTGRLRCFPIVADGPWDRPASRPRRSVIRRAPVTWLNGSGAAHGTLAPVRRWPPRWAGRRDSSLNSTAPTRALTPGHAPVPYSLTGRQREAQRHGQPPRSRGWLDQLVDFRIAALPSKSRSLSRSAPDRARSVCLGRRGPDRFRAPIPISIWAGSRPMGHSFHPSANKHQSACNDVYMRSGRTLLALSIGTLVMPVSARAVR